MSHARRMIVRHPALQAFGWVLALHYFIWWVEPAASGVQRVVGMLLLTALPVGSSLLHRDSARDLGIRLDNLFRSGREVLLVTIIGSLLILGWSAGLGWESKLSPRSAITVAGYLFWAFSQQFALQAFVFRRLKESARCPRSASAMAAALFGAVHLPNPILVLTTTLAGYVWCRLYARSPNLFTLALSHAWLATMLLNHVPSAHHVMRLGPRFLAAP